MKNILILVDMQNGFCKTKKTREVVSRIETLLKKQTFDAVIATRFLNADNSPFAKMLNWNKMIENNPITKYEKEETKIVKPLKKYIHAVLFKRGCYGLDKDFSLDTLMETINDIIGNADKKQIFIAGVDTDCSVLATAISLFENGICPIVLTKYCASNGGKKSHKAGLTCLKRLIGQKQLIDSETIKFKE